MGKLSHRKEVGQVKRVMSNNFNCLIPTKADVVATRVEERRRVHLWKTSPRRKVRRIEKLIRDQPRPQTAHEITSF